jgi:hypothetical protein
MRSIEIAITNLSTDTLAVSIDYRLEASPIVKKWQADRTVVDGIWRGVRDAVAEGLLTPPSAREDPPCRRETADGLRRLGLALFQQVLGREGDRIRDLAAEAVTSSGDRPVVIFKIDKTLAYLPLEMMHDGRAYLCHSLPVGRVLYAEDTGVRPVLRAKKPLSIVLVADPSEDGAISRDVEREIDAVRRVFRSGGDFALKIAVGREADEKRILADLPGAAVFHVTGHGTFDEDERLSGIKLGQGRVLSGPSLEGLLDAPTFAFLNVCAPASEQTWKGSMGLIETLLKRGTRACVASLWDLRSPSATFVAVRFYAHLLAGVTFGEALRRARLEAAEKMGFDDPTWAAYALYGDPRLTLVDPGADVAAAGARHKRRALRQAAFLGALVILAALVLIPVATIKDRPDRIGLGLPAARDTLDATPSPSVVKPARVGYLVVESRPAEARVLVDGEERGVTPSAIEVRAGKHEVTLVKAGYKQWEASVEVRESRRASVDVNLEKLKR